MDEDMDEDMDMDMDMNMDMNMNMNIRLRINIFNTKNTKNTKNTNNNIENCNVVCVPRECNFFCGMKRTAKNPKLSIHYIIYTFIVASAGKHAVVFYAMFIHVSQFGHAYSHSA